MSMTEHSFWKCICPLLRMFVQESVQSDLQTNTILLRVSGADLSSELREVKTLYLSSQLRSDSYFFSSFSRQDSSLKRTNTSEYGIVTLYNVCSIIRLPSLSLVRPKPTIFFSMIEERPMSSLEPFRVISHFIGNRNTAQRLSFLSQSTSVHIDRKTVFSPNNLAYFCRTSISF